MHIAPTDHAGLPQGDPALLDTELAQRLLAAPIPARLAFVALDGRAVCDERGVHRPGHVGRARSRGDPPALHRPEVTGLHPKTITK